MNIISTIKKSKKIVYFFLEAVLLLSSIIILLSVFNIPYLKLNIFSVNSGSMRPSIRPGDMVFVVPKRIYKVGDIITFKSSEESGLRHRNTTTHRISKISEDGLSINTKGDANRDQDLTEINKEKVVGKVLFSLPLLGYLSNFVKTQQGFLFLIIVPATIIIYSEVLNLKEEIKKLFKTKKVKNKVSKEVKTS